MKEKPKLKLWDIFCISSGAMISSGLFILPVIAYKYSGPSIVIAYFLAGILMIPSILSKSELLSAMPKSGGTYFFIERSFGPILGIFGGLSSWFSMSLKSAFALVGIGVFLEYIVPNASMADPHFYMQVKMIAMGFCLFFIVINILSVNLTARIQNSMVVFLLLVCAAYIFLGLKGVSLDNLKPILPQESGPFFSVVGLIFISYGGLTKVASIAEDTENPSRTIPLGMFLSFLVVQAIYCLSVAVTIGVLGPEQMASTLTPLTQGALTIGGLGFGILLSLAALTAFFSTANAGMLAASRVPFAMAKDDLLPIKFSRFSKKNNTPYFSIISTGLFMLFLIIFLDLESLVKVASTLMIILFMFVNLAVIIMREAKMINYRPSFRSPFYPWVQIFAILAYGFLMFKMGKAPVFIGLSFVGVSLIWFIFCAPKVKRQFGLMHLVERITAKEFVDNSLEDELKEILHKRDHIVKDRFDKLIERAPVLDIFEAMNRDEFFTYTADLLAEPLAVEAAQIKKLLIKREDESHTVIEKGLAIPHIIVPGVGKFEIILVRAREGIIFSAQEPPVHIIFVLAGSQDVRNFHLRVLMAIAQIVRAGNFYQDWMRMKDKESLRMLLLSSTRKRDL